MKRKDIDKALKKPAGLFHTAEITTLPPTPKSRELK